MASLISHLVSFDTAGPVPKEMRGISSSSPTVTVGMSTKLYTSEMSLLRSLSVSPSSSHNSAKVLHVAQSEYSVFSSSQLQWSPKQWPLYRIVHTQRYQLQLECRDWFTTALCLHQECPDSKCFYEWNYCSREGCSTASATVSL